jgi:2-amino-4-hydroxy-6-hydroxymethyldihydropteridine diphosphokinase
MPLGPAAITETKPVMAYIGLGANEGDPRRQLEEAVTRLAATEEIELVKASSFYLNPPLGPPDQHWYVNAVIQVRTRLAPEELLRVLHRVEQDLGRVRRERWGPRRMDLDLLLYNGVILSGPDLCLPHPEMQNRSFVLVPLAEIAPQAWHPGLEKTASELLGMLDPEDRESLKKLTGEQSPSRDRDNS